MTKLKPQIQTAHSQRKVYSFVLGEIKLEFMLRIDIKKEMENFLQLLERAKEEINNDLK